MVTTINEWEHGPMYDVFYEDGHYHVISERQVNVDDGRIDEYMVSVCGRPRHINPEIDVNSQTTNIRRDHPSLCTACMQPDRMISRRMKETINKVNVDQVIDCKPMVKMARILNLSDREVLISGEAGPGASMLVKIQPDSIVTLSMHDYNICKKSDALQGMIHERYVEIDICDHFFTFNLPESTQRHIIGTIKESKDSYDANTHKLVRSAISMCENHYMEMSSQLIGEAFRHVWYKHPDLCYTCKVIYNRFHKGREEVSSRKKKRKFNQFKG